MFVNKVYLEFIHTHTYIYFHCAFGVDTHIFGENISRSQSIQNPYYEPNCTSFFASNARGNYAKNYLFVKTNNFRRWTDENVTNIAAMHCIQQAPIPTAPHNCICECRWCRSLEPEPEPEQELKMLIETRQDVCAHIIMAWHGYYFHKFQYLLWILVYFSFNTKKISILMQ